MLPTLIAGLDRQRFADVMQRQKKPEQCPLSLKNPGPLSKMLFIAIHHAQRMRPERECNLNPDRSA